jgi:hypothetical protein
MVKVIGSIYTGNNTIGDFNWMIKQSVYTNCLFIFNDNIECLIYVRVNGSEWDEETFNTAINHMSIKCLKYIISNGCPYDGSVRP